jgi:hypothetical protein
LTQFKQENGIVRKNGAPIFTSAQLKTIYSDFMAKTQCVLVSVFAVAFMLWAFLSSYLPSGRALRVSRGALLSLEVWLSRWIEDSSTCNFVAECIVIATYIVVLGLCVFTFDYITHNSVYRNKDGVCRDIYLAHKEYYDKRYGCRGYKW